VLLILLALSGRIAIPSPATHVSSDSPTNYRVVDRYVVHEGRDRLGDRLVGVLPEDAEYIVVDLDRTVHLGITIGECLGWELLGDPEGPSVHAPVDGEIGPFFTMREPLRSARGLVRGVHHWGMAGLFYAGTVRLGDRWPAWNRLMTVAIGPDYVDDVQAILRSVLMASTAGYTRGQLRAYAARAWTRWRRQLVIDPAVVEAMRRRCPRLRAVIISSASTAPTVEHAADTLGVDGYVSSAVDVYRIEEDEVFSAPAAIPSWLRRGRPLFFSRPGAVVHNSSSKKVSFLRMHYPEVFAPGVVSVAISDNNYGEDRSWPNHFRHVIALNSRHPFSPLLEKSSPCESIQAVDALPIASDVARHRRFDWHGKLRPFASSGKPLAERFVDGELDRLEELRERLRVARDRASSEVDGSLRRHMAAIGSRLTDAVDKYNAAPIGEKPALARSVYRLVRELRRARSALERAGRDCARIRHEMECLHATAARAVATREL